MKYFLENSMHARFYFGQSSLFSQMTLQRLILSFFFLGLMTACSLDAQILDLSQEVIRNLSEKGSTIEVTPSSSQGVYSTGGYEAQVSVNYYYSKPEIQTSQGYTIQTSFQSTLYKE